MRSLPLLLLVALTPAPGGAAVVHPSLVDVATTRCADCHDDLWESGAALHPPAEDDCTNCHDFTKTDSGTEVALLEEGTALCLMCHDGFTAAVEAELETPHFPVTDDCTTCHSPHGSKEERLLLMPVGELCSTCHDRGDLSAAHKDQLIPGVRCQSCHDPHGSQNPHMLAAAKLHPPFEEGSCTACHRQPLFDRIRLRNRGEKLCTSCHGEFDPPADGGSVHAALQGARGRAGCLSCHSPHMSPQRKLLLAAGGEVCRQCHGEVVTLALAKGGHPPAADDCMNCHQPHVADNPRLLQQAPEELCTFCHDSGDDELRASHLGADLGSLECVACHNPHGSEHPALLAENLHWPVLDGCDTCHDGAWNQHLEGGAPDLCLLCHEDVGDAAEAAAVPHGAMEIGTCTDCHNPHASPQQKLIKAPGAGPCADCHDEQVAGPGEVAHGVIGILGCRACHEPHGGANEKLLRRTGAELCLSCHAPTGPKVDGKAGTVTLLGHFELAVGELPLASMTSLRLSGDGTRDHPVTNHLALGTPTKQELKRSGSSYQGELTCLTCHDPHKGRSSQMFRWNAASPVEACQHCHPQ